MKIFNNIIIYLVCASIVSSCTYKKVDKQQHESAAAGIATSSKTTPASSERAAKIEALDLVKLREKAKAIKTAADAMAVIKEIETVTVNSEVWMDDTIRLKDKVISSLTEYNYAMIHLIKLDAASESTKTQLKKYQDMTLFGCNELMEDCKNIDWLRRDPRSSLVLAKIIGTIDTRLKDKCDDKSCEADYHLYYDLLSAAFPIANATEQVDLKALYLKRAITFSTLNKGKGLTETTLARHGRIFQMLLNQQPIEIRDERIEAIVKQYKPWSYSRLKTKLFPFGAEKIFSYASKHLMYEADGSLSEDLKSAIAESQNTNDQSGITFKKRYQDLKTTETSKYIFSGLRFNTEALDQDEFYDEYFYMIDRFYRDHIDLEEVTSIWNGTKKNNKRFLEVTLAYIKVELISLIVTTNQYFAKIVGLKNLPSDRMFRKTIDESQPLTQVWEKFFVRVEKISLLITQQIKGSSVDDTADLYEQISVIFKGINKNVKYLSVYPNMLMVGFFMINLNAGLTIDTWWGAKITIDPKTIVSWMMNGEFDQPWYLFAGGSGSLNKTEIIYAFYYALNTGAFETFSVIKNDKGGPQLDRLNFFKDAFKKTVETEIAAIDKSIIALQDFQSNPDAKTFMTECDKLKEKPNGDFTVNVNIKDLQYFSLYGGPTKGTVKLAGQFYEKLTNYYWTSGDDYNKDTRWTLRSRLQDRLTQMKAMKIPLLENIGRMTFSPEKAKNDKIKKDLNDAIEAEASEAETKLKRYLELSLKTHRSVDDCVDKMQWMERQRQSQIFNLEINFLLDIYNALKDINNAPEANRGKMAEAKEKSLGLGEFENLASGIYKYSVFDLITRLGEYSKKLKPALTVDKTDDQTKNSLASDVRKIPYLNPATGIPVSPEEFVASAMSFLSGQGNSSIQWLKDTQSLKLYFTQIASLIAMYRTAIDLKLEKDPQHSVDPSEIVNKAIRMAEFVNIKGDELKWMNIMGQTEIIARTELQGYLFDESEINYRGILDNVYNMVVKSDTDLSEAARYYLESQKLGALIFPIPAAITKSITGQYQELVNRSQKIICDFNKVVSDAEKNIDPKNLRITYRIQAGQPIVYTPSMVFDPSTILLNPDRRNQTNKGIDDFFRTSVFNFYKQESCK